jgi:plastocyanin
MPKSWFVALAALGAACTVAWAGTVHTVDQKAKVFSQPELTVKVGDQIKVANKDDVTHSLFAKSAEYTIRETQAPGTESTFTFDKAGTVELRCAIHPQMVLKVTVTP